jgi:hypothetical protein
MAIEYYFPNPTDQYSKEIPIWMVFDACKYSTFAKNRTRGYVQNYAAARIVLPYPQSHGTSNTQQYMSGKYPDLEGLFNKEDYKLKEEEMNNSFTQGLGIMSYDHLETVLTPGARRTHRFDINLTAKNSDHAFRINRIARAFQTYMFPSSFTQSVLNMSHPPLWSFYASGKNMTFEQSKFWDGDPLVSVLQSVDINHSPIQNLPITTPDFIPLAVNIKLTFIELEPAMQLGTGELGLISRSENFTF